MPYKLTQYLRGEDGKVYRPGSSVKIPKAAKLTLPEESRISIGRDRDAVQPNPVATYGTDQQDEAEETTGENTTGRQVAAATPRPGAKPAEGKPGVKPPTAEEAAAAQRALDQQDADAAGKSEQK